MNIFLDHTKWADDNTGQPSLAWNPTTKRYEVLTANNGWDSAAFAIYTLYPTMEGDTIEFDYDAGNIQPSSGHSEWFLNIVDQSTSSVAYSVNLKNNPKGRVTFQTQPGVYYTVAMTYGAHDYYTGYFQSIEILLTPVVAGASASQKLPWWYCPPKEAPEACPVRPAGFIPLSEYDADFRFPLKSSRVPSKPRKTEGCTPCSPNLLTKGTPPPTTPEICAQLLVSAYSNPMVINSINMPNWFNADSMFVLRLDNSPGLYYMFANTNGYGHETETEEGLPFPDQDSVLKGEIALSIDASWEDHNWTCAYVSQQMPT